MLSYSKQSVSKVSRAKELKQFFSRKHSPFEFDHFRSLNEKEQTIISIYALKYKFLTQESSKKQNRNDFRAKSKTNLRQNPAVL